MLTSGAQEWVLLCQMCAPVQAALCKWTSSVARGDESVTLCLKKKETKQGPTRGGKSLYWRVEKWLGQSRAVAIQ